MSPPWRQLSSPPARRRPKNDRIVVQGAVAAWLGHFQITDTSGPAACKGVQVSGAYTYTLTGNQLALKVGFDQCSGRKTILTAHPLTKIASPPS